MAWGGTGGGGSAREAGAVLAGFRRELYACF
jgi:hypothetical protein